MLQFTILNILFIGSLVLSNIFVEKRLKKG